MGSVPLSLTPDCRLLSALGCRGQLGGCWAGAPVRGSCCRPRARDPVFFVGTVRVGFPSTTQRREERARVRDATQARPCLRGLRQNEVLGCMHLGLDLVLLWKAPGRGVLTFLLHV